ncbi:unnamed protein product [Pedinophyceae sp. YPF-701]|nr:unnamed protein product [Pedinophyceae sp. YPF-701]
MTSFVGTTCRWHLRTCNVALRATKRRASTTRTAAAANQTGGRQQGAVGPAEPAKGDVVDLQPPKGTRDFQPGDMRVRNWLFDQFRQVALTFGFEEWDAPVLESEDLYTRKAGEEITQQLYCFEDKGGRRVSLRPELTPSLARMVLARGKGLPLPAKWFAIGQCWRYERMTRGRRREHYQWNMDIFGVSGVEAEAELLAAIVAFFRRVGLSSAHVGLKVSSRKILEAVLETQGVPADAFGPVCIVVDKIDKLPRENIVAELSNLGVEEAAIDSIFAALEIRSIDDLETLLGADDPVAADLRRLFELARGYGIDDWLVLDTSVVRGLAYYTGLVFEGFDRAGKLRAICGGGRYDRLLSTFGGEDTPAVGFGFGDAVIVELLEEHNLLPSPPHHVQDVVVCLDEDLRTHACLAASSLREAGRKVDLVLEAKKMKWVFKHCDRLEADRLIILGAKEWERGVLRVKDLREREESDVAIDDLV